MVRGNWFRFGYACVNFGKPFSMKTYLAQNQLDMRKLEKEERFKKVALLADILMTEVGRIVPVLPVALVAKTLCDQYPRRIDTLSLKAKVNALIEKLTGAGAHVYLPREDRDYAITVGLRMLTLRSLIEEEEGQFRAKQGQLPVLAYYANSIAHFDQEPGPDPERDRQITT